MKRLSSLKWLAPYSIITFLNLSIYLNSIGNGLVMDDRYLIGQNLIIRNINNLPAIFTSDYWEGTNISPSGLFRPLIIFSFFIQYMLSKDSPTLFHLVNLILHCINTIVLYLLLKKLIAKPRMPFLASIIFSLHPIHTEAVLSITGRAEIIAMTFLSLSILFFYI